MILFLPLLVSLTSAAPIPLQMVDMTYAFDNSTLHWPEQNGFQITVVENGTQKEGYWLQTEEYFSGTHVGTHMDAPCHFAKGHACIDQVPFDRLIAPAAVIDFSARAANDSEALVRVQDLQKWERISGASLNHTIVLVRSGWGKRWPDKKSYTGTTTNEVDKLHFPGVSKEAARWLVDKRDIYGLGIDTLSLDYGQSKDFMAHQILLGNDIFGIENVANMDKIPIFGATLYVMPMKISNASGAPTRIVATFPKVMFDNNKGVTERTLREVIIFN